MKLAGMILCASLLLALAGNITAQPPGGSAHDILTCVRMSSDGTYLVGGYSSSFLVNETAAIISLLEPSGKARWTSTYDSKLWDEAADVMVDEDGNCWLAGATRTADDSFHWLVCKYSSAGLLLWSKTYFTEQESVASGIISDGAMGAFITGTVELDSAKQIGLLHIDELGAIDWSYISDYELDHNAAAIEMNQDGHLIVAGQRNAVDESAADIYVAQFHPDGSFEWDTHLTLPQSQYCGGLSLTPAGEIVIAGSTVADSISEQTDGLLLKLSDHGELIWQRTQGEETNDSWCGVVSVGEDSLLVCGVMQDPVTLIQSAAVSFVGASGETIWTRSYDFQQHAELRGIDGRSSEDFLAVGLRTIQSCSP